jgi:uncharacterized protein (TIGR00255 family)
MLRSMTGQGLSRAETALGPLSVELRTVNNRHFKLVMRLSGALQRFESEIERIVRQSVQRGTVQLTALWQRTDLVAPYQLQRGTLASYFRQLSQLRSELGVQTAIDLGQLATLPGVVEEAPLEPADEERVWNLFVPVLHGALSDLTRMRDAEGESMQGTIDVDLAKIRQSIEAVRQLAPGVVESYRQRITARVQAVLSDQGIRVQPADLLREVQLFADRCDVHEELSRLESHLKLFSDAMRQDAASGRKLDFVIQEMFRETNTIGSKGSDATIAQHVVEMKCAIERIRELVQNVE